VRCARKCGQEPLDVLGAHAGRKAIFGPLQHLVVLEEKRRAHSLEGDEFGEPMTGPRRLRSAATSMDVSRTTRNTPYKIAYRMGCLPNQVSSSRTHNWPRDQFGAASADATPARQGREAINKKPKIGLRRPTSGLSV
jgi:hypothetical protein